MLRPQGGTKICSLKIGSNFFTYPTQTAAVLDWPLGYASGLAISNDAEYLTVGGLLALEEVFSEEFGSNLFFSTSAFLLNPNTQNPGFSIFESPSDNIIAANIHKHLKSGVIDGIHALVDADQGPVPSSLLNPLVRHLSNQFRFRWWSNHGSLLNRQNIGHQTLQNYQEGDLLTSEHYSLGLARKLGIRFFALDDDNRVEFSPKLKKILRTRLCRDGSSITAFQRYRGLAGLPAPTLDSFSQQLNSKLLKRLMIRRGGLIAYQHMGITSRVGGMVDKVLENKWDVPDSAITTLREISNLQSRGLWFTRTSTFLDFIHARSSIFPTARGNHLVLGGQGDGQEVKLDNIAVRVSKPIKHISFLPSLTLEKTPYWECRKTSSGHAVMFGDSN